MQLYEVCKTKVHIGWPLTLEFKIPVFIPRERGGREEVWTLVQRQLIWTSFEQLHTVTGLVTVPCLGFFAFWNAFGKPETLVAFEQLQAANELLFSNSE